MRGMLTLASDMKSRRVRRVNGNDIHVTTDCVRAAARGLSASRRVFFSLVSLKTRIEAALCPSRCCLINLKRPYDIVSTAAANAPIYCLLLYYTCIARNVRVRLSTRSQLNVELDASWNNFPSATQM